MLVLFFFSSEDLREYVTVMICVAVNGQPTIGVIHKPFEQKTCETQLQVAKFSFPF